MSIPCPELVVPTSKLRCSVFPGGFGLYNPGGGAPVVDNTFRMTVETTVADETFDFNLLGSAPVPNFTIDWGDGETSEITSNTDPDLVHTYATPGTHSIAVSAATMTSVYIRGGPDEAKIRSVDNLGSVGIVRLDSAFRGATGCTTFVTGSASMPELTKAVDMIRSIDAAFIDCRNWNAPNCDDFGLFAYNTPSITSMDFTGADLSGAIQIDGLAWNCTNLATLKGLEAFDGAPLTNIANTLRNIAATDMKISGWDVSAVTNAAGFLISSALTTAEYDATLIAWGAQSVQSGVTISFGSSTYTSGGAAEAGRDALIAAGWTITDGGPA